ncbi:MAG TPA: ADOP family duplicated permease [Candidatus Limnocylindrales bacterium]|nr:ADOP family duplicated permease [Candidatus Limnocylindrales bacterium]
MSFWARAINLFRGERVSREIEEELATHITEGIAEGRDPAEVRKALGPALQIREESRDLRIIPWLDSLRFDFVFGCRQLVKRKVTSAAAILSLALAVGSCTAAFRLIDAMLLRSLPVKDPEQLYDLTRHLVDFDGKPASYDEWAYPAFRRMRDAVKDQAELIAISSNLTVELTYRSEQEMEKANLAYVSGGMFDSFGLRPVIGRLLSASDDLTPGAYPYAVLSHDYWARRFGKDPNVVGRTFRMDHTVYQIAGVVQAPFTGTSPGTVTDIFLPAMMSGKTERDDATWIRTIARVKPGTAIALLQANLNAISHAFEEERAKHFVGMNKVQTARFLAETVTLEPAAAGVSNLQGDYRRSLLALGVLVALVLLIACANVANLMIAQATARAREMALRVSIGAGRARLVQLVLVECACLALLASALGGLFAWWAAPFVVRMISTSGKPIQLLLPADWRVFGFGLLLTAAVILLFGLAPALRASGIKPASALKGGDDVHVRRRLMHGLIAVQVAFCFLILFVAGLFVATFDRLSNRPMGFSADHILVLDVIPSRPQPAVVWDEVADRLRGAPGVENVAIASWAVFTANSMNNFISLHGEPPGPVLTYFLNVSPRWRKTMRLKLVAGRDFRPDEATPGAALVNETFAREYFNGENPVGKSFLRGRTTVPYRVVGLVADAPYRSIREPILPVAYVPFRQVDAAGAPGSYGHASFIVRTGGANPLAVAQTMRLEVTRARSDFRVSSIDTQEELIRAQTLRERLLATLAVFFGCVALLLAVIGLYGVLDYSVLQRRREIGIRLAIGAPASRIARTVTLEVFSMVVIGAVAGLALGFWSIRYVETLLYQVEATDVSMLALPSLILFGAAFLAAVPAAIRAVRIDPVAMLRAE